MGQEIWYITKHGPLNVKLILGLAQQSCKNNVINYRFKDLHFKTQANKQVPCHLS